jgi:hypothetical protein
MTVQPDFFRHNKSPQFGLQVRMQHLKPCCGQADITVIGHGCGPHYAELHCANCGRHRGWMSKSTASWIETIIQKFGAPTEPIVVRLPIPAEAGSTAGASGTHEQTKRKCSI